MKETPGIIVVTIEATDYDMKKFILTKAITFEEARDTFDYFMKNLSAEWKEGFSLV